MDTAREEILRRLDAESFYVNEGIKFTGAVNADGWRPGKCPFHEDKSSSFSVHVEHGGWRCFADCGQGSPFDFLIKSRSIEFKEALAILAAQTNVELSTGIPDIPESIVLEACARLEQKPEIIEKLWHTRGLTQDTLRRFQVGFEKGRITIPVRDERGKLRNIRKYLPKFLRRGDKSGAKFYNHTLRVKTKDGKERRQGYGGNRLLNIKALTEAEAGRQVVVCAGEPDCLLLNQHGFLAVSGTSGETTPMKSEWFPLFKDKPVAVIYDNDAAGKRGAHLVAEALTRNGCEVRIVELPEDVGTGGDVTDYFMQCNGTTESLQALIDAAPVFRVPELENEEPTEISFQKTGHHEYVGKLVKFRTLISGRDDTPYTVPRCVAFKCPVGTMDACPRCPAAKYGGAWQHEFSDHDDALIKFCGISKNAMRSEFKYQFGMQCQGWSYDKDNIEYYNVELLALLPDVNRFSIENEAGSMASRVGFLIGRDLRSNARYEMIGRVLPDPRDQHATVLISQATPVQDNVDAFTITEEIADELYTTFGCGETFEDVLERFTDIADNMAANVHRIAGRPELQWAFDMVWHSVLTFDFGARSLQKGWVEGAVIGDTGQGKSALMDALLVHYGMGDKVNAETSTFAGIIGGLEKIQDRWFINWGKIPLNDRLAIIVEELSGWKKENGDLIGKLSEIRSSGIVEITKIRTERTYARTRLLFTGNPVGGGSMESQPEGVIALLNLFGAKEDLRRLDFGMAVADGEVSEAAIHESVMRERGEPKYPSTLCKQLLLWAWSRKRDNVHFTKDAIESVRTASLALSKKYHSSIPLVQDTTIWEKVAKLACATAARVFSADLKDPNILIVKDCHVRFAHYFLERIYDAESFGYNTYSANRYRVIERFEKDFETHFFAMIENPHWRDVANAIWELGMQFQKADLTSALGIGARETRGFWPRLLKSGALTLHNNKCKRSTPFNKWLKTHVRNQADQNGGTPELNAEPAAVQQSESSTGADPWDDGGGEIF